MQHKQLKFIGSLTHFFHQHIKKSGRYLAGVIVAVSDDLSRGGLAVVRIGPLRDCLSKVIDYNLICSLFIFVQAILNLLFHELAVCLDHLCFAFQKVLTIGERVLQLANEVA